MGEKESRVTLPSAGEVEEGGEGWRDIPIVPVKIQVLILNHADSLTLVRGVQGVCKAWRDIASKLLRQKQDILIRQVGLVPPPPETESEATPQQQPSVALLQWECNESEKTKRNWNQSTQLLVSIHEGGVKSKEEKIRRRFDSKPSKVWTGQQVYQGDIFQEFFNEANTTGFARSFKCKDKLNTQALQELIKLMVLASGPTIRQEWKLSHECGGTYDDMLWCCSFCFTPNTTSASWSIWGTSSLSDEGAESREMALSFQFQQYISQY